MKSGLLAAGAALTSGFDVPIEHQGYEGSNPTARSNTQDRAYVNAQGASQPHAASQRSLGSRPRSAVPASWSSQSRDDTGNGLLSRVKTFFTGEDRKDSRSRLLPPAPPVLSNIHSIVGSIKQPDQVHPYGNYGNGFASNRNPQQYAVNNDNFSGLGRSISQQHDVQTVAPDSISAGSVDVGKLLSPIPQIFVVEDCIVLIPKPQEFYRFVCIFFYDYRQV